ncbi:MarR family transcriptional regulator [Candidatus Woesearchaeota archaeon]|nr:MarR family transcriptional regulator [Candidatus Woesearchaeota archaeon]
MNYRHVGVGLIGLSLILFFSVFILHNQVEGAITKLMESSGGTCISEEGSCLHEISSAPFYLGLFSSTVLFLLGLYLLFLKEEVKPIKIQSLNEERPAPVDRFSILIKGLTPQERAVILAIKEQDGISQSTLRIRTDLSKTKLSVVLSQLEAKNLIRKIKKGKINYLYLKERF